MELVFNVVFPALKGSSSNLAKAKAILSTLRDVIKYSNQAALSSKFNQIYETLQSMHHAAKDTLKTKTGKKAAKAKYTKFRASVLKCFARLMQKDPKSLVPHAEKFMKETAPLFADPGLLADFITALYSVDDEAVKASVKDTHLPKVMAQLMNEVKKTTISTFIRSTWLDNSLFCDTAVVPTGGQGINPTNSGMVDLGPISVWKSNVVESFGASFALGRILAFPVARNFFSSGNMSCLHHNLNCVCSLPLY
jgi:hypothetical protein